MARTYNIETSITTDYRKDRWGIERIVLDGISNHLPADSKGTKTSVKLKQNGKFVDLDKADPQLETEEVIFEDNGSGYDAGLLSVLYSPKAADALSVGQFGEGLKLISAAALRNGLSMEFRSRNWFARPFGKKETIGNNNLERLCFEVRENGDHLEGSRTVFSNPNSGLIKAIFELPNSVLALNKRYREVYNEKDAVKIEGGYFNVKLKGLKKTDLDGIDFSEIINTYSNAGDMKIHTGRVGFKGKYNSRIIDLRKKNKNIFGRPEKAIFVKGIRVEKCSALFDYDLGLENISPDRIYVDRDSILDEIRSLLENCSDTRVIEKVMKHAIKNPHSYCWEFQAFENRVLRSHNSHPNDRLEEMMKSKIMSSYENNEMLESMRTEFEEDNRDNLWVKTFKKLNGENAVISSDSSVCNEDAKAMGYKPIRVNNAIANYLSSHGIKRADSVRNKIEYRWVSPQDLTKDEREVLSQAEKINRFLFGTSNPVGVGGNMDPVALKVYSGMYAESGREVKSEDGVYQRSSNPDGTVERTIGIRRDVLASREIFVKKYLHEVGHHATGATDGNREFDDFFVSALAKVISGYINEERGE
jgi:hypothetical protein